jgi:hypothetical protein
VSAAREQPRLTPVDCPREDERSPPGQGAFLAFRRGMRNTGCRTGRHANAEAGAVLHSAAAQAVRPGRYEDGVAWHQRSARPRRIDG